MNSALLLYISDGCVMDSNEMHNNNNAFCMHIPTQNIILPTLSTLPPYPPPPSPLLSQKHPDEWPSV